MDLGKTHDCHLHDPLIAKLTVYDFDKTALPLITDCLINHLSHVKEGWIFSSDLPMFEGFPLAL